MPDGGNEIWKKGQEVWSGKKKNFLGESLKMENEGFGNGKLGGLEGRTAVPGGPPPHKLGNVPAN